MNFVKHEIHEKWICGHIAIAKYQQYDGIIGEFYMAYDRSNMSNRVRKEPFKSFDECKKFCEEYVK